MSVGGPTMALTTAPVPARVPERAPIRIKEDVIDPWYVLREVLHDKRKEPTVLRDEVEELLRPQDGRRPFISNCGEQDIVKLVLGDIVDPTVRKTTFAAEFVKQEITNENFPDGPHRPALARPVSELHHKPLMLEAFLSPAGPVLATVPFLAAMRMGGGDVRQVQPERELGRRSLPSSF